MNIFKPSTQKSDQTRIQFRILLLVILTYSGFIFASVGTITKKNFSISYPNNYDTLSGLLPFALPSNDSAYTLFDTASQETFTAGASYPLKQNTRSTTLLGLFTFGAMDTSMVLTDSSTLVLGKYSFITKGFTEKKSTANTTRMYATREGNIGFIAYIYYPTSNPEFKEQMEAAMATLNLLASTKIHSSHARRKPFSQPNQSSEFTSHFNLLGRKAYDKK